MQRQGSETLFAQSADLRVGSERAAAPLAPSDRPQRYWSARSAMGAFATTPLCLGLGTMALPTGGEDQERG